jgi:hypothetical protein
MTMFAGDEELVLSMERFAPSLRSVSCGTEVTMAFESNTTYNAAVESWEWVNSNEKRTFILVANAGAGCVANGTRQPWVVSNAAYSPGDLTVYLNATRGEWGKVAHTYNLDFGRYTPPTGDLSRRFSGNKQVVLDLTASFPETFFTSVDVAKGLNVAVSCANCSTTGTLTLSGHIETSFFSVKVFTLNAVPRGIVADLHTSFSITASDPLLTLSPPPLQFVTIPLGGFAIPNIITLGPELSLGAGVSLNGLTGKGTISVPITATIPDDSVANMNLAGSKSATFSGWEPQISQGPLDISAAVSCSAAVFGRAEIGVALELFDQGIDVALVLKVPNFVLTASLVADPKGVCDTKEFVTGVTLGASVGFDLSLTGSASVAGTETPFFQLPMAHFGASTPAKPQFCRGFGVSTNLTQSLLNNALDGSKTAMVTVSTAAPTDITTLATVPTSMPIGKFH